MSEELKVKAIKERFQEEIKENEDFYKTQETSLVEKTNNAWIQLHRIDVDYICKIEHVCIALISYEDRVKDLEELEWRLRTALSHATIPDRYKYLVENLPPIKENKNANK